MSKEEDQNMKFLELQARVQKMEALTERILQKIQHSQNKTSVLVSNKQHEPYPR